MQQRCANLTFTILPLPVHHLWSLPITFSPKSCTIESLPHDLWIYWLSLFYSMFLAYIIWTFLSFCPGRAQVAVEVEYSGAGLGWQGATTAGCGKQTAGAHGESKRAQEQGDACQGGKWTFAQSKGNQPQSTLMASRHVQSQILWIVITDGSEENLTLKSIHDRLESIYYRTQCTKFLLTFFACMSL